MLVRLLVENFALAERIELTLGAGLTVLTGETGAGKSLIVDALALLAGGRGAADFIRTGADSAVIEAVFRAGDEGVRAELRERGLEGDGDEIVVRRVLSREGRHRTYVNGGQVPANAAAALIERLLDLHGQHEQQSLLTPAAHLALLDEAAGITAAVATYRHSFAEHQRLAAERDELARMTRERAQRIDYLRFQIDEIAALKPAAGEFAELENERKRLQNADRLAGVCAEGDEQLYSGEGAAAVRLKTLAKRLEEAARFDQRFTEFAAEARELAVRSEELARSLGDYAARAEADPTRLDAVNQRLDDLAKLRKKYGDLDAVPAALEAMQRELETLEDGDARLASAEAALSTLARKLQAAALELRAARRKASEPFAGRIEHALRPLGMREATLQWSFRELDAPGPTGVDAVELLLSANRGEPCKPLHKVASGGELSRVMLALHAVALQGGGPDCVIFDEIDAGIGGDVGNAVGTALRKVAENRQVLCVTHLAQIAACAGAHWVVAKTATGERTVSHVRKLTAAERQEEIGRMLGGRVDDASKKHARALLERAGT